MKQKKRGKRVGVPKKTRRFRISRFLLSLAPVLLLIIGVICGVIWLQQEKEPNLSQNGLPAIKIDLNGATLDEIKDGDKNQRYFDNEVSVFEGDAVEKYSGVRIKGRGNSTWEHDKRPFQLKFQSKVDLFGLGKTKKWVLLANYIDFSQIRNDAAFYIANILEMDFVPKGQFVELYFGGDFQGLYYVTPQIEIGKSQVDLREQSGILVEVDNLHGRYGNEADCFYSNEKMCLTLIDVVDKNMSSISMNDFVASFDQLEIAAQKKDWPTVQSLIDVKSFVDYFLVSEFTVDPDAYTSSWFMYKDGANDKIHAGPVWDYDFALGNREWIWKNGDNDFYKPDNDMVREIEALGSKTMPDGKVVSGEINTTVSKVFYHLMMIPEFRLAVEKEYQEKMSGRETELLQYLRWQSNYIEPALIRDNDRWGIDGYMSYRVETDYLLEWIKLRYLHFEDTYGENRQHPLVLT